MKLLKDKLISIRMATELYVKLVEWAEEENRSVNNLIETILFRALEGRGNNHGVG